MFNSSWCFDKTFLKTKTYPELLRIKTDLERLKNISPRLRFDTDTMYQALPMTPRKNPVINLIKRFFGIK